MAKRKHKTTATEAKMRLARERLINKATLTMLSDARGEADFWKQQAASDALMAMLHSFETIMDLLESGYSRERELRQALLVGGTMMRLIGLGLDDDDLWFDASTGQWVSDDDIPTRPG